MKETIGYMQNEWTVTTDERNVVLTYSAGAFGLPVSQITIYGGCAASVAKAITKAAKETKRWAQLNTFNRQNTTD